MCAETFIRMCCRVVSGGDHTPHEQQPSQSGMPPRVKFRQINFSGSDRKFGVGEFYPEIIAAAMSKMTDVLISSR